MENQLYPIFLKANNFKILIVGGGNVAQEKLDFLLKSSPNANVYIVAKQFNDRVLETIKDFGLDYKNGTFKKKDLRGVALVIGATNDPKTNKKIHKYAKERNILVNIADTPKLCDYYMGSIVTKGNLKVAFSTNGKSPTLAKRLRQFFEQVLPDDINELAGNLDKYRKNISGDFQYKVEELNRITESIIKTNIN